MYRMIAGALALGWLAAPIASQAAVTFTTDTATDLAGTFAVSGTTVESATPAAFNFGLSFCLPVRVSRGTTATVGLQCAGAPDDPRTSMTVLATAQSGAGVSGTTSALAGSGVPTFYFSYWDLQDTGGAAGTYSGSFCYSRSANVCPVFGPAGVPATLGGFYPPVEPPSVATNEAKAGQTVPLKFYAQTNDGPITDLAGASLAITGVACADVAAATDAVEEYSTGADVTLENLGGGYYQYNWKTPKAYAGTCKAVTLSLPEPYTTPTHPTATFEFRR